MGAQGAAQGWHGHRTHNTQALGKGEAHQTTGIPKTRNHALNRCSIGGGNGTSPQLLTQLLRQVSGLLNAQLLISTSRWHRQLLRQGS
ncbi:hypothetical protein LBMAG39_00130 [Cyanobium sp.]|nr:hypothetical protein LBMAG39_00130 [Cyanobium sp.]